MSSKRAINLARVSTPRQAELYSLDYQLEQMRQYDAETGLAIVAEFKDDMTGRKLERDGLEEACQMLERDEADVLVTWKFDRLHRNYVNSVVLRERIRRAGKDIHYASTRQISGKTARQRLPEDLQYIMAEIEADDIVERTDQGRKNKVAAGKWIGLGRPPYGYNKVGQGRNASLVVNEEQAKIIRQVFTWYVVGDGESGPLSTLRIAERLTERGIPTPQDLIPGRVHMKIRGYAQWSRATIHKIIRHSAYNGIFYQFRYKAVNGQPLANRDRDTWVGVPVPRIVDEELFNAAQRRMDQGRPLSNRGARFDYLVGRRVTCECGYKMRSISTGKAHKLKDGTITEYAWHFYRCPGRTAAHNRAHSCDMPPVHVTELDNRVWSWVKEEIANPAILERKLQEIQQGQRDAGSGVLERLRTLYEHKGEIEAELKRIGTLYAKGMPEGIVEELISEQNRKLQLTTEEIRKLEQEKETPLTDDTINSLIAFSYQLGEHLAAIEERFDAKRTVVDGLDVRVEVVRKSGEIWLRLQCILRDDVVSIPLLRSNSSSS